MRHVGSDAERKRHHRQGGEERRLPERSYCVARRAVHPPATETIACRDALLSSARRRRTNRLMQT
jgi:hypothetical protein